MDVTSDILVVSLPVALLWNLRITRWQKAGLSLTLCLSLVMVLVAIIRSAGVKHAGTVDIVWLTFWKQQECSIAVIMVSVIAFRSFFVAATKTPPKLPIVSRRFIRAKTQSPTLGESETIDLTDCRSGKTSTGSSLPVQPPRIPSPTHTSVGGSIHDARSSSSRMADSSSENLRLSPSGVYDHVPPRPDGESRGTRREELETLEESQWSARKHGPSSQTRLIGPSDKICPDGDAEYAQPSTKKLSRWNRISRWSRRWSDETQTGYWSVLTMFRTGYARSIEQSGV